MTAVNPTGEVSSPVVKLTYQGEPVLSWQDTAGRQTVLFSRLDGSVVVVEPWPTGSWWGMVKAAGWLTVMAFGWWTL